MSFSNIKLILGREIRDQLRDRRTLFMIAVLPILLYPLLGMSMLQLAQFMQEQPSRVLVIGATRLDGIPPLFDGAFFSDALFSEIGRAKLLELDFDANLRRPGEVAADPRDRAAEEIQSGRYEAVLYFPSNFATRLDAFRAAIHVRSDKVAAADSRIEPRLAVPSPEILYSTATDKSQIAFARLSDVLRRWTEQIGDANLAQSGVSALAVRPFSVGSDDIADQSGHRGAAMWSKLLPVLLLLWALTGAFYPAIDLCAGEKERGTLETLLSSPAQRSEIVLGKLVTVMLFSMATVVLNMASIGVTGRMVMAHLPGFEMPPLVAIIALSVALVPIAALFSALCVALAAFARSTKEGQYYLMPLLLITMPLVVLPMAPGVELNLGNSLIPITGMVLLLRNVLEGNYWLAVQYSPAVIGVTILACMLAIRWAVDQFNSESVLFRESERLDVGLWLRRLRHDRQPTPSVAMALCCGMLILVLNFFMGMRQSPPTDLASLARSFLIPQLLIIAPLALLMAFFLTTNPRQTLLLKWPKVSAIFAAGLLAIVLHPAANVLKIVVSRLYPIGDSMRPALEKIEGLLRQADFWPLILLIAIAPAVCEELAFRGFILSGFRHLGHKWRAMVFSAVLFGLAHGILQQSLIACLLGTILAFVAVQSGSILPGMVFHAMHNALAVANSRVTPDMISQSSLLRGLLTPTNDGGYRFQWPVVVAGSLAAVLLLVWFARLNAPKSPEEVLEEAIGHNDHEQGPLMPEEAVAVADCRL